MYFDYAQCKQKGFAPILLLIGILVIMIVAGGAYYLGRSAAPKSSSAPITITSTPLPTIADETANWKTYTNDLNISFKYPNNWVFKPHEINGGKELHGLVELMPEGWKSENGTIAPLVIQYWDNPNNLTVKQYDEKINQNAAMLYPLYDEQSQQMTVGNLTGFYNSKADCSPFACHKYTVATKNKIWEIYSQYTTDSNFYKGIINQILSTFKFTQ